MATTRTDPEEGRVSLQSHHAHRSDKRKAGWHLTEGPKDRAEGLVTGQIIWHPGLALSGSNGHITAKIKGESRNRSEGSIGRKVETSGLLSTGQSPG